MKRRYAKELAKITNTCDIKEMLNKAKENIKDWTKASVANKGLSRGTHWNIFAKGYNEMQSFSEIHKYRLIQEYGKYLPSSIIERVIKKKDPINIKPVHHDPIF